MVTYFRLTPSLYDGKHRGTSLLRSPWLTVHLQRFFLHLLASLVIRRVRKSRQNSVQQTGHELRDPLRYFCISVSALPPSHRPERSTAEHRAIDESHRRQQQEFHSNSLRQLYLILCDSLFKKCEFRINVK